MFVYSVPPIDFWQGWQKPSDLFRAHVDASTEGFYDPAGWFAMWRKAQDLASQVG